MAENQILPFAQGQDANVLSQSDYAGDAMRLAGHQPGVARSALENKALRQATSMAAGLAQFIADGQADDVTDAKTPAEIAAMLADASTANVMEPATYSGVPQYIKFKNGVIIQWGSNTVSASNSLRVSYPIAFPNNARSIIATLNAWDANFPTNGYLQTYADQAGSFVLTNKYTQNATVFWVAIGY